LVHHGAAGAGLALLCLPVGGRGDMPRPGAPGASKQTRQTRGCLGGEFFGEVMDAVPVNCSWIYFTMLIVS